MGPLQVWFSARTVRPTYPVYYWYLNGIVADRDGAKLLVAAQGIGALLRVDTATAAGSVVDTGQTTLGADGLLLTGRRTLIAVLNYDPPAAGTGVYRLRLSADWRTAAEPDRLPDPGLLDPTTVGRDDRGRLLVVNSQLEHAPGRPPLHRHRLDQQDTTNNTMKASSITGTIGASGRDPEHISKARVQPSTACSHRVPRRKRSAALALLFTCITALLTSPIAPAAAAVPITYVIPNAPARVVAHRCQELAYFADAVQVVQCTDLAYKDHGPNEFEAWGYTQIICLEQHTGATVPCGSVLCLADD